MRRLCAIAVGCFTALLGAQGQPPIMIEWPHAGSDGSQTKYSAAADINPSNVSRLALEWQWRPNEQRLADGTEPGNFQGTPLMIDDVLYLSTSFNRVVALNAETGAVRWAFDPKAYLDGPGINLYYQHRGVAFWREGNESRIFMNSHDRLFAVDAKTGQLITSFGQNGYAMLREALRSHENKIEMRRLRLRLYKNLVIVGAASLIAQRAAIRWDRPGVRCRTGKRVGFSIRFRGPENSATRPGRTTPGRSPAMRMCGEP
jgi:quinoprotein glucose dehydrogenase